MRAAYPSFGDDAETRQVYLDALADVDAGAVGRAVDELLREGREEPPPPGVIRSRALGLQPAPTAGAGDSRDRGARKGVGWVGVLAAIALAAGVIALVVALTDDDGGTTTTSPGITVTQDAPEVEQPSPGGEEPTTAP